MMWTNFIHNLTDDCIVVEPDYDGVRLEKDMTLEFIEDMIERFKNGKKIHRKYAYQIVLKAKDIFYAEPTMPEVSIVEGKKLTVCGDTHGISLSLSLLARLLTLNRSILRSPRDLQP